MQLKELDRADSAPLWLSDEQEAWSELAAPPERARYRPHVPDQLKMLVDCAGTSQCLGARAPFMSLVDPALPGALVSPSMVSRQYFSAIREVSNASAHLPTTSELYAVINSSALNVGAQRGIDPINEGIEFYWGGKKPSMSGRDYPRFLQWATRIVALSDGPDSRAPSFEAKRSATEVLGYLQNDVLGADFEVNPKTGDLIFAWKFTNDRSFTIDINATGDVSLCDRGSSVEIRYNVPKGKINRVGRILVDAGVISPRAEKGSEWSVFLVAKDVNQRELTALIKGVDRMIREERLGNLNDIIRQSLRKSVNIKAGVATLRVSYVIRSKLPVWKLLLASVQSALEARGRDAAKVLRGLY